MQFGYRSSNSRLYTAAAAAAALHTQIHASSVGIRCVLQEVVRSEKRFYREGRGVR